MLTKFSRKTFSKNGISRQWENVTHNVQFFAILCTGKHQREYMGKFTCCALVLVYILIAKQSKV